MINAQAADRGSPGGGPSDVTGVWTAGGPQDHTPRKGTRALPPLPCGQTLRLTLATAALSTAPGLREACVPSAGSPAALGQSPGTVLGSCVRTCPAQSHPAGAPPNTGWARGPVSPATLKSGAGSSFSQNSCGLGGAYPGGQKRNLRPDAAWTHGQLSAGAESHRAPGDCGLLCAGTAARLGS